MQSLETAVENGKQALEQPCKPNGPRLALLDWIMPELDGPSVCRAIRARAEQPYAYMVLLTSKGPRKKPCWVSNLEPTTI
jgi:CheY-like chemotaxis protein